MEIKEVTSVCECVCEREWLWYEDSHCASCMQDVKMSCKWDNGSKFTFIQITVIENQHSSHKHFTVHCYDRPASSVNYTFNSLTSPPVWDYAVVHLWIIRDNSTPVDAGVAENDDKSTSHTHIDLCHIVAVWLCVHWVLNRRKRTLFVFFTLRKKLSFVVIVNEHK